MTGSILDEAKRIVGGSRQAEYGKPEDCFKTIAELWSTWLERTVSAQDVAIMLILFKVARAREPLLREGTVKRDTLVDIAGYAACCAKTGVAEQPKEADEEPPEGAPEPPRGWRLVRPEEELRLGDEFHMVGEWNRGSEADVAVGHIRYNWTDEDGYYWAREIAE